MDERCDSFGLGFTASGLELPNRRSLFPADEAAVDPQIEMPESFASCALSGCVYGSTSGRSQFFRSPFAPTLRFSIADFQGQKTFCAGTTRILFTGMSAVGKSSIIEELGRRGYKAVDLNAPRTGCASHQGRFYSLFDKVVLLTASESLTKERLTTRTNNDFSKPSEKLAKMLADKAAFEEKLKNGADVVIDTEAPFDAGRRDPRTWRVARRRRLPVDRYRGGLLMRSVTYSMNVSADGYIVGPDGDFDWSEPNEEVFRFWIDEIRGVGVHLMGRRLYETMLYWETADQDRSLDEAELEWVSLWNPLPKVVFSTTLSEVEGNARLASGGVGEEIEWLRAEAGEGEIAIGGATLAAEAAALDLIDEYRIMVYPVLVGGGIPFFPQRERRVDLELVETHTFSSRFVYLRYRVAR